MIKIKTDAASLIDVASDFVLRADKSQHNERNMKNR